MSGILWPLPWKRRNHPFTGEILLVSSFEIKSSYNDQQSLMPSSSNWPFHLPSPWFIPTNLLEDPQGFCTAVPSAWNALLPSHHRACSLTSFRVLLKCHLVEVDFPDYHFSRLFPILLLCSSFLCSTYISCIVCIYLFVVCLPQSECELHEGKIWSGSKLYFIPGIVNDGWQVLSNN